MYKQIKFVTHKIIIRSIHLFGFNKNKINLLIDLDECR